MEKLFTKPAYVIITAAICNMLWGSAYPAIKIGYELFAVTDAPQKILFASIRFILAGLMVLALSVPIQKKAPTFKKEAFFPILLTAFVYTFLEYIFFYIGLSNTTGSNGSIFNSTSTFMAVIIAHFVYKDDKLTAKKLIGSAIGFAGVIAATMSGGRFSFKPDGEGFIMLAALCFVIGSMISKHAAKTTPVMTVTGYNLLFGGIMLTVFGLAPGGMLTQISAKGIFVLLYLAFLSACAFTLWTMLLKYNPVGSISVYNFIIPVFGTLLSALLLKEDALRWEYLLSLALVCAGIIIVNAPKKAQKP
ncbi:MAG: DMT family transporter [Clostridiales bacterium]|nr:DMT family transporter [Clostridiales bacterium]